MKNNKQYLQILNQPLGSTIVSLKLIIDEQTHDISTSFDNSGEGWYYQFRILFSRKIFFHKLVSAENWRYNNCGSKIWICVQMFIHIRRYTINRYIQLSLSIYIYIYLYIWVYTLIKQNMKLPTLNVIT